MGGLNNRGRTGLIHGNGRILIVRGKPSENPRLNMPMIRQESGRPPAAAAPFGVYAIGMFSWGFFEALHATINMTPLLVNQPVHPPIIHFLTISDGRILLQLPF